MNEYDLQRMADLRPYISRFAKCYKYKRVVYIALKDSKEIYIQHGRVTLLTAQPPDDAIPTKIDTEHLVARVTVQPFDGNVDGLIEELTQGVLSTADGPVQLPKPGERANAGQYHYQFSLGVVTPPSTEPRLAGFSVYGRSKFDLHNLLGGEWRLDDEVRRFVPPFDALSDLYGHLQIADMQNASSDAHLQLLFAPAILVRPSSKIVGGKAKVELVVSEHLDPSKIYVGYKAFGRGSLSRDGFYGKSLEKGESPGVGLQLVIANFDVPDCQLLQCFVNYEDQLVQHFIVTDPKSHLNIGRVLLEVYDKDVEVLGRFLAGHGDNPSRNFESGVTALFMMLGFNAVHLAGIPGLGECPDILAVYGDTIVPIECTLLDLNNKDKLSKLIRRTEVLKAALANAGLGRLSVQPVIASALDRKKIEADLDKAAQFGVSVVSQEELQIWTRNSHLLPMPSNLLQTLMQLIPPRQAQPIQGT